MYICNPGASNSFISDNYAAKHVSGWLLFGGLCCKNETRNKTKQFVSSKNYLNKMVSYAMKFGLFTLSCCLISVVVAAGSSNTSEKDTAKKDEDKTPSKDDAVMVNMEVLNGNNDDGDSDYERQEFVPVKGGKHKTVSEVASDAAALGLEPMSVLTLYGAVKKVRKLPEPVLKVATEMLNRGSSTNEQQVIYGSALDVRRKNNNKKTTTETRTTTTRSDKDTKDDTKNNPGGTTLNKPNTSDKDDDSKDDNKKDNKDGTKKDNKDDDEASEKD